MPADVKKPNSVCVGERLASALAEVLALETGSLLAKADCHSRSNSSLAFVNMSLNAWKLADAFAVISESLAPGFEAVAAPATDEGALDLDKRPKLSSENLLANEVDSGFFA